MWKVLGLLLVASALLMANVARAGQFDEDETRCICPRHLNPVCGSDNKTYGNRCLLHCQMEAQTGRSIGLRMVHKGRCDN